MSKNFNLNLQLFGEGAEENGISAQQLVKAREVDFVTRFEGGVMKDLMDALGVARKVPMMEGTTLYVYKTDGELQSGTVAEGEVIPLSSYVRRREPVGDITLKKWRKATTAESIKQCGYAQAVRETDKSLMSDVQKGVRADFFTFLTGVVQPASGSRAGEVLGPAPGAV